MKRPPSIRVKTEEMDHQKEDRKLDLLDIGLNLSFKSANHLDPPREIILKNYSLAPDMIGGWKPKKAERRIIKNPFPLNY